MDSYIVNISILGVVGLLALWLPSLMARLRISYTILFMVLGFLLYSCFDNLPWPSPFRDEILTVRLTELVVIISLMGTGLKIDKPFHWRAWHVPMRLLVVAMLLCIAALFGLGYAVAGLSAASAMLLAASMAPTDPVLAGDVQLDGPNKGKNDTPRFALTCEAGMNDGMAFPFVWMAIALATAGTAAGSGEWVASWVAYDLVYKVLAGVGMGLLSGYALNYLFFHLPRKYRLKEVQEGVMAISATLVVYGATELVHGYGFIAVFVTAVTLRNR